jgi:outer membrane protein TolC
MRIESEIIHVQAQRQEATTQVRNAAIYFNFLLERPADAEIAADTFHTVPQPDPAADVTAREELAQIKTGLQITEHALALEKTHFSPRLGAQLDIGSQAYGLNWGGYILGGVHLEIPIWDNKKSQLRRQEYRAAMESAELKHTWTQHAFEVELKTEKEQLTSDITLYESYTELLNSNQRYYRETERRYKEGLSNYIELLDARTQITNTQLQQNLVKYKAWLRYAGIERISASASIH